MSTPSEADNARIRAKAREVRQLAAQLDSRGRAMLAVECVRGIYDAVKFDNPEGEGLDGRDGPERRGLGRLCDAAIGYTRDMAATSATDRLA